MKRAITTFLIHNDSLRAKGLKDRFNLKLVDIDNHRGWQPDVDGYDSMSVESQVEACVEVLETIHSALSQNNEVLDACISSYTFENYSADLYPELLRRIGAIDVALYIWLRRIPGKKIRQEGVKVGSEVIFTGPIFHHPSDEDNFFRWINSIGGVLSVKGSDTDLFVSLSSDCTSEVRNEFGALFKRYAIDIETVRFADVQN